jgi:hypothetical protein
MVIKDKFRLISGMPNVINLSQSVIKTYQTEENNPRHIFAFLELKKKNLNHFTNNTIFKFISNTKTRDSLQVVNFEKYPLYNTYNPPTKGMIINLKPFEVEEISNLSANDLYAAIVYSYAFSKMVTGKFKISENYARIIVSFLLSMLVQLFGKEYGLVGIYASGIPKLKFLLACYILAAFYGRANGKNLYQKASSIAPYMFNNEYDALGKYDFSKIEDFIKSVSELGVMPGLSLIKFTSKVHAFLKINGLAAFEDISRFFCFILTISVPGTKMVPTWVAKKYNEKQYYILVDIMRKMF